MKIILASKSPRRKELLSLITKKFDVIVSTSDENVDSSLLPIEQVKEIAKQKAEDVFNKLDEDGIVIGSDTIVVSKDGEILGKPKDENDDKRMLTKLQNSVHEVMTGIAIFIKFNGKIIRIVDADIAKVHITMLSEEEIQRWLNTGNAWDKAGAYAIQQEFAIHIDKINGSFATVMGLPVHKVYNYIKNYLK